MADKAPEIGDLAPDFTLPGTDGKDEFTITLSELRPSPVVIYFYPRDNTSGCTREAKDFSALIEEFERIGVKVFGISKDSIASHKRFIEKHGLKVPLLSDAESDVAERYGVWKEKSMYGRKFFGIERSTFLIDGEGRIAAAWRKVKVPGHAEAVLEAARELVGKN